MNTPAPQRFRKTAEIEAAQWQPDGTMAIFEGYKYVNRRVGVDAHGVEYTVCDVGIRTKEGFMHIKPGDWIITGVEGERYACDAGIFAKSYEPAGVARSEIERTIELPIGWSAKLISTNPKVYQIKTPYGDRVAQQTFDMPHILFELVHAAVTSKAPTIEQMVDRFLSWPLPKDFSPDCGVKFTPVNHPNCWPIGTNLLNADQAKAMLEHVLSEPK